MKKDTFESNKYYDIIEQGEKTTILSDSYFIYKVQAKEDISVSATMIAYDADGAVVGKNTDDIVLTKGKNNFFEFYFDAEREKIKSTTVTVEFKKDSFLIGKRNAVEMVSYNQSGYDTYLTLKQVEDNPGTFGKFKLIFYKDGKIVDTDEGYLNVYTNLTGKGSTDVAKIWNDTVCDNIEFIYEP